MDLNQIKSRIDSDNQKNEFEERYKSSMSKRRNGIKDDVLSGVIEFFQSGPDFTPYKHGLGWNVKYNGQDIFSFMILDLNQDLSLKLKLSDLSRKKESEIYININVDFPGKDKEPEKNPHGHFTTSVKSNPDNQYQLMKEAVVKGTAKFTLSYNYQKKTYDNIKSALKDI